MQPEPPDPPANANADKPGAIPSARPMRLVDLMMLVAGAALTSAVWPLLTSMITFPAALRSLGIDSVDDILKTRVLWTGQIVLTFYCWSPLLAIALLARPRDHRRWAARSYGTAAVAAASVALVIEVAALLADHFRQGITSIWIDMPNCYYSPFVERLSQTGLAAAAAMMGAWVTLALTGVGRRPSGWLEWLCLATAMLFVPYIVWGAYASYG